jgi:hypothetical protein
VEYSEKRIYPRMQVECPARIEMAGDRFNRAVVKNLSGGGLMIWVDREIAAGAMLKVEVRPICDTTPPMVAEVDVLRSSPLAGGAGSFALACRINRLLG